MKQLPLVLALLAIAASGFAVPPERGIDRTKTLPLAEPIAISIDDLALSVHNRHAFKESHIPKRVRDLDGKRVRMIGVMFPSFEETGIKEFLFHGDTRSKWYSWTSDWDSVPVQYHIVVKMRDGMAASYSHQPVEVEGQLMIEANSIHGVLNNVYRIEDATVRPGKRQKGFKQSMGIGC